MVWSMFVTIPLLRWSMLTTNATTGRVIRLVSFFGLIVVNLGRYKNETLLGFYA